jgi:hypothetical protein
MAEMEPNQTKPASTMFAEPPVEKSFPTTAVGIAAAVVVVLAVVLVLLGRGHSSAAPNTVQPQADYARYLILGDVAMSEASNGTGGKLTYIDGHIANHGPATVTGVTVQVVFANDAAMPPQVETLPMTLIRMREPYIDTEPVSAAPLAPAGEADFRLIFENVGDTWNQQVPEIRVIQVETRK